MNSKQGLLLPKPPRKLERNLSSHGTLQQRNDRTKRYWTEGGFDSGLIQNRLENARITVVGVGGLCCPALESLARMGVGVRGGITIIDGDFVEESNLNRQKLFSEEQVGMKKALAARERLKEIDGNAHIIARPHFFKSCDEHGQLWPHEEDFALADVIISGVDSDGTRLEITQKALRHDKPHLDGAVDVNTGRILILRNPRDEACFGCVITDDNYEAINDRWGCKHLPQTTVPSIATTVSIVGEVLAFETIKLVTGIGNVIDNALYFNVLNWSTGIERFKKREDCYQCSWPWWAR